MVTPPLLYSHSGNIAQIIYIREWQAAKLEGEKHKPWEWREKKKKLCPGYIMELWATDTHCKHQSGMEKHLTHDFNPPHPTERRSGNWTLHKNQDVEGKMNESWEGGKNGWVDKWEAVHKQGPICSIIQVPQREQYARGGPRKRKYNMGMGCDSYLFR